MTTVVLLSEESDRLNVQHVVPVFQLTKSHVPHGVGHIRSRSVKTSGRRRSTLNAPVLANWRSVDALMGRGRASASDSIGITEYHAFFDGKVADVHATTADADPAMYPPALPDCELSEFRPLTTSDIINAVKLLPDKQCSADPMPTWLSKEGVDDLAPFLCHLFNVSLEHGNVPSTFKTSSITQLLKKLDLVLADVKSYRPISNLSVMSKLLERHSAIGYRLQVIGV